MVCSDVGVEFCSGGLIGFELLDCNLKLANRSSANVVAGPAQSKKNGQCHNQNSQIHRHSENDLQISFGANFFSVL